ncbi:MAG: LysR family transcriptional regulator [Chloroflexi bacterium]|nr:LysR family transcriptional regulator [Chloroflexota bacterium]
MEIHQLRVLVAVANTGSLSAGGRKAGLTQPAVTRLIQRLEKEVGAPILKRGASGIELTPQGEALLGFARRMLAEYDSLVAQIAAPSNDLAGRLRIISSTTPGEYLVPELVSSFNRLHPRVAAEVLVTDSAAVLDELLDRQWDIGFVGRRTQNSAFVFRPVAWDEIVLAVPGRHPFAKRGVIPLSELAGQVFIEREDGSGTRLSVRDAFAQRGLKLPEWRVAMVLGSTHAVVSAVDSGLGVGFVTARALEQHPPSRVSAVRISEAPLTRLLYMVRHRPGPPSPIVRAFERHVTKVLPRVESIEPPRTFAPRSRRTRMRRSGRTR